MTTELQTDVLMTVIELAALLRVDRKTAYAAVRSGAVPGVRRFGRVFRIHRGAVLAWLAQNAQTETTPVSDRASRKPRPA